MLLLYPQQWNVGDKVAPLANCSQPVYETVSSGSELYCHLYGLDILMTRLQFCTATMTHVKPLLMSVRLLPNIWNL